MLNDYADNIIAKFESFIKLIQDCDSGPEYALRCALDGDCDLGTPEFFEKNVFEFLSSYTPRRLMKYKLFMRDNIAKLQRFYEELKSRS